MKMPICTVHFWKSTLTFFTGLCSAANYRTSKFTKANSKYESKIPSNDPLCHCTALIDAQLYIMYMMEGEGGREGLQMDEKRCSASLICWFNNITSNEFFHDFICPTVDCLDSCICVRPCNGSFHHVTPSTMKL